MGKKLICIIMILSLALSNIVVAYGKTTSAKVTSVSGTVTVKRSGSSKEFNAFVNMSIGVGDKITTNSKGSVSILVDDVNVMTAGKSTSFTINDLSEVGKEPSSAYTVHSGSVSNSVNKKGSAKDSYKVNTSNTVMGVRGTVFEVAKRISEIGEEFVSLITIDGTVVVSNIVADENGLNTVEEVGSVRANEQITFRNNDEKSGEVVALDISKLDAESLRWILSNDKFLNEEQVRTVGTALDNAEKFEKEREDKINRQVEQNEKGPTFDIMPQLPNVPNDSKNDNIVIENNDNNDDSTVEPEKPSDPTDNGEDGTDETGEDGTDETGEDGTDETGEDGTDETGEDGTDETGEDGTDETGEDGTDETGEDGTDITDETAVDESDNVLKDYDIHTVNEFVKLNNVINTYGSSVVGVVNINADLDLSNVTNWKPAILDGVTIYGNHNTISNLRIFSFNQNKNTGLFAEINNSTIKDLSLDSILAIDIEEANSVGALAGVIGTGCEITNIDVFNSRLLGNFAGGVSGKAYSPMSNIDVVGTKVTGEYAGGVTGKYFRDAKDQSSAFLSGFTVSNGTEINGFTVGGVAGSSANLIFDSVTVTETTLNGFNLENGNFGGIGGIVGELINSTIEKSSVNNVNINTTYGPVGAIAGYTYESVITKSSVRNGINLVSTKGAVGGIVGQADASEITNNSLNGGISINSDEGPVGGIIGESNGGVIEYCNINGVVSINSKLGPAGGVIGKGEQSYIGNVVIETTVTISSDVTTGEIIGENIGCKIVNEEVR